MEVPIGRQELREKSQDFAVRYYEAIEADDYELAEKLTLEHLHLIDEYVAGVIPEKHTCNDSCLRNSFEWLAEHKKSVRDWNGFIDNICRRAGIGEKK